MKAGATVCHGCCPGTVRERRALRLTARALRTLQRLLPLIALGALMTLSGGGQ